MRLRIDKSKGKAMSIYVLLYLLIALAFLVPTLAEGSERGVWDGARIAGLALCMLWPALLATVTIVVITEKRQSYE
jgi:hypothetical protein